MIIEWFNSPFDYKLEKWKEFRDSITDLTVEEKLDKTALVFSKVPFSEKRTIDYYTPSTWPSPWELINCNIHCFSTISLMMFHTLKFVGVDVKLLLIEEGGYEYLAPYHEGTDSILNIYPRTVSKLSELEDVKIISSINI